MSMSVHDKCLHIYIYILIHNSLVPKDAMIGLRTSYSILGEGWAMDFQGLRAIFMGAQCIDKTGVYRPINIFIYFLTCCSCECIYKISKCFAWNQALMKTTYAHCLYVYIYLYIYKFIYKYIYKYIYKFIDVL
jgi:hypothetical protein